METKRAQELIGLIMSKGPISISEIQFHMVEKISIPTLNRELAKLRSKQIILTEGKGQVLNILLTFISS